MAVLGARGLSWSDRLGMLRLMRGLKAMSWAPPREWTVLQLLRHYAQSDTPDPPAMGSALPGRAEHAHRPGQRRLYARVLRDSLGGRREASDLLLPCTDLSALWPDAAARHLTMRYGSTVRQLQPSQDGVVVNQERFDAAVLAVPPPRRAPAGRALREAGAGGLLDALVLRLPADRHAESPAGRPLAPARTHDDAARGSARGHLG